MIFASPLHNFIFSPNRLDKLPLRGRNFIYPYCKVRGELVWFLGGSDNRIHIFR